MAGKLWPRLSSICISICISVCLSFCLCACACVCGWLHLGKLCLQLWEMGRSGAYRAFSQAAWPNHKLMRFLLHFKWPTGLGGTTRQLPLHSRIIIRCSVDRLTEQQSDCCCCSFCWVFMSLLTWLKMPSIFIRCCFYCCCSHVSHAIEPCSINLFDLCSRAAAQAFHSNKCRLSAPCNCFGHLLLFSLLLLLLLPPLSPCVMRL